MAKPIRAVELPYPMIQFLIMTYTLNFLFHCGIFNMFLNLLVVIHAACDREESIALVSLALIPLTRWNAVTLLVILTPCHACVHDHP